MAVSLTTKDDINAFVALYTAHGLPRLIQNTGDEKCVSKRCWQSTIIICASHNQKRKTAGSGVYTLSVLGSRYTRDDHTIQDDLTQGLKYIPRHLDNAVKVFIGSLSVNLSLSIFELLIILM